MVIFLASAALERRHLGKTAAQHQGLSLENERPHQIQSRCSGIWTTSSQAKLEILKAVQVE